MPRITTPQTPQKHQASVQFILTRAMHSQEAVLNSTLTCCYVVALLPCLQSSYSHDGIFISIGASCGGAGPKAEAGIMSTLYAFSKSALYSTSRPPHKIFAATYIGAMSWKSSISHKEQSLIKEDYRTFNNLITPARPQDEGDVEEVPLFVMKVSGLHCHQHMACFVLRHIVILHSRWGEVHQWFCWPHQGSAQPLPVAPAPCKASGGAWAWALSGP